MNILVVDDEDAIVKGIVHHIEKISGFSGRVLGAASADEALKIMEYFRPDLLLTDIRMPGMDGLDLLSIVQERRLCDNCIILTAYENFQYARQAIRHHAIDYLVKPIDWEILDDYIQSLMMKSSSKKSYKKILNDYSDLFMELNRTDISYSLNKIINFVNSNFTRDISLSALASYSGMSQNYICNIFKKELGITFLDYIHKLRIRKAMEIMVSEEKRTIKDIAFTVGYQSERQLFRIFKSITDLTPQQFRENNIFKTGNTPSGLHHQ